LCKKDTLLKDKDYNEVVQAMEDAGDLDVAFQVVQDFFVCNPIATYFDQMTSALKQVIAAGRPNSQLTSGSTG